MKFTLSWLKDFLETDASLDEIATTLTAIGLEVEEIVDQAAALAPFIVAQIEEAVQHPGADKLRVCRVNDGTSLRQVVCGAANARAGIKVILAREGVTIPANGMVIRKSTIRNVESNGMLCSGSELGLNDDGAGIVELPASAPLGESIVNVLGLGDPVIDIAVTPNRADCLGVAGIARDLAAAGIGELKSMKELKNQFSDSSVPPSLSITLSTPACPLFIGCSIHGVTNGPSPAWLQQRLKAIGLRPISALVDITNFMTIAYGRPLHVFDAAKLAGNITVRHAREGETLKALDGKEYRLSPAMIAVCDDSGVVGLGGIIGGEATACDENTTEVFLEAALFDPTLIARAGRMLGIESDARYRFERGVDPAFVRQGAEIALAMISELCGGSPQPLVVAGKEPEWKRIVRFNTGKVKTLGGVTLPNDRIESILVTLGFALKGNEVTPPSWRADIEGEADLVEEVLRIARYDAIPSTVLPHVPKAQLPAQTQRASLTRKTLAAGGMTEICSWAFVSQAHAALFGNTQAPRLMNPISADMDTMRPRLLPGLLAAIAHNAARGFDSLALFEIGNVFEDVTSKGQKQMAAGVRSADAAPRNPFKTERKVDVFDAKADLFLLLNAAGLNAGKLAVDRNVPAWYHPTRAGRISLGGKVTLGYFGEIHPLTLNAFGIRNTVVALEAFLDSIPYPKAKTTARSSFTVSNFQTVERDFAFVSDERIAASDIVKAIEAAEKQLIQSVTLFDIYSGKGVETGKKSVALSVTLQAHDRTLTEQEIEAAAQKIISSVKPLGLTIRV